MKNTIVLESLISPERLNQIAEIVLQSDGNLWVAEIGKGALTAKNELTFQGITLHYYPEAVESAIKFLELTKTFTD